MSWLFKCVEPLSLEYSNEFWVNLMALWKKSFSKALWEGCEFCTGYIEIDNEPRLVARFILYYWDGSRQEAHRVVFHVPLERDALSVHVRELLASKNKVVMEAFYESATNPFSTSYMREVWRDRPDWAPTDEEVADDQARYDDDIIAATLDADAKRGAIDWWD